MSSHAAAPASKAGSTLPNRASLARKGYCDGLAGDLERRVLNSPDNHHASASAARLAQQLSLTLRQAEVLHWIAEGKSNEQISQILECSVNTVKNHIKEIFQRLGVHSRTAAAAFAYRCLFSAGKASTAQPAPSFISSVESA